MKSLVAGLMLVVLSANLVSQPIFVPHKGEKTLLELSTWSAAEIAHKGEPCGKYFLYQLVRDQDVVTLKVPLTEKEERLATNSLIRADMRTVLIRLDDEKRVPTAEWVFPGKESPFLRRVLIRISSQDLAAAGCLTFLRPS